MTQSVVPLQSTIEYLTGAFQKANLSMSNRTHQTENNPEIIGVVFILLFLFHQTLNGKQELQSCRAAGAF
jgi:hypothetical protein